MSRHYRARSFTKALIQLDRRLNTWSHWYLSVVESGLGYASVPWNDIIKLGCRIQGSRQPILPYDEVAETMETHINRMRQKAPELARILHAQYLTPGTINEKARKLHLSSTALRVELYAAKVWLLAHSDLL